MKNLRIWTIASLIVLSVASHVAHAFTWSLTSTVVTIHAADNATATGSTTDPNGSVNFVVFGYFDSRNNWVQEKSVPISNFKLFGLGIYNFDATVTPKDLAFNNFRVSPSTGSPPMYSPDHDFIVDPSEHYAAWANCLTNTATNVTVIP